jgi:peptidyl-prolyl cis-trans isomerase SurA
MNISKLTATLLTLFIGFAQCAIAADGRPENEINNQINSDKNDFTITAIVNNYPITIYDINQRLAFVLSTTGLNPDSKTSSQLANRVLNNLIDEQLQMQEAEKNGIVIDDAEIEAAIEQIEKDNKKSSGSLIAFLQSKEIDPETLRSQLKAQIAWGRYIQKKIAPTLQVSDSELQRYTEQYLYKQKHVEEALLATIEIPNLTIISRQFGNDDAGQLAAKLTEQLRGGVDFEQLAKQLNISGAGSINQSWVPIAALPPELGIKVKSATPPTFLNPVKAVNGFQIVLVREKRFADYSSNGEVLFKEIMLRLEPNAVKSEVDVLMSIAKNVRKNAGSCTNLDVAGATDLAELNFDVKYLRLNLSDLSPQIKPLIRNLKIEETSEPFATPDGIRLLKLCEKTTSALPKAEKEKLMLQIKEEKLRLEAIREIRSLKQKSFIEIKN